MFPFENLWMNKNTHKLCENMKFRNEKKRIHNRRILCRMMMVSYALEGKSYTVSLIQPKYSIAALRQEILTTFVEIMNSIHTKRNHMLFCLKHSIQHFMEWRERRMETSCFCYNIFNIILLYRGSLSFRLMGHEPL